MSQLQHFCPACFGNEMWIEEKGVIRTPVESPDIAHCSLCGWQGPLRESLAAISPENMSFWTGDRVAQAMLLTAAKHCGWPMLQALEVLGLVPRLEGSAEQQESAQGVREAVVKAVIDASVTAAFEAAAAHAPAHYERFAPAQAAAVERVFSYSGPSHDQS